MVRGAIRVVIVNYNAGPLLLDCVQAVAASSLAVDIVVVDNASSDGSIEGLLAAGLPGVTVLRNRANLGFARANNQALRAVSSEYVLLLNPDCLVEPDTLEKVLRILEKQPIAGMAGCLIRNPDGSEQVGCRRLAPTPARLFAGLPGRTVFNLAGTPLPGEAVPVEAISGAFMLVRRAALEAVGLLDEGYFMHWEDLDWCMRFQRAGWSIWFVPDATAVHVKGACSQHALFRVERDKHRGMVRYYDKFFRETYPLPLLWAIYAAVGLRYGVRVLLLTVGKLRGTT